MKIELHYNFVKKYVSSLWDAILCNKNLDLDQLSNSAHIQAEKPTLCQAT